MNANVVQLILVLAGGIGGVAAVQAMIHGRSNERGPDRRSFRLGERTIRPRA